MIRANFRLILHNNYLVLGRLMKRTCSTLMEPIFNDYL